MRPDEIAWMTCGDPKVVWTDPARPPTSELSRQAGGLPPSLGRAAFADRSCRTSDEVAAQPPTGIKNPSERCSGAWRTEKIPFGGEAEGGGPHLSECCEGVSDELCGYA